ncbi:uncharacterized protein [Palaemon carinicauda]|uniref:uncharacterized protein n=1 Tax=Palaemon carinicauda TaxID=392227 RepID=UPI0035B66052
MNNDGELLIPRKGISSDKQHLISSTMGQTERSIIFRKNFTDRLSSCLLASHRIVCECCFKDLMVGGQCKTCPECSRKYGEPSSPSDGRKCTGPGPRPAKFDEVPSANFQYRRSRPHVPKCNKPSQSFNRSNNLDMFLRNHVNACQENLQNCQNMETSITTAMEDKEKMKKIFLQCNKKLEALKADISNLQEMNIRRIQRLDRDKCRLKGRRCTVEAISKKIRAFKGKLDVVNRFEEAVQLTDEDPYVEVSAGLRDIQKFVKDDELRGERLLQISKELEVRVEITEGCLRQQEDEISEPDDCDEVGYLEPCITKSLATCSLLSRRITITDLLALDQFTKCRVQGGTVFAAQNFKHRRRYAKFFISETNQLLLGHLQDIELPQNSQVVEYSEIMKIREHHLQQLFLELSDGRTSLGRLYINILPDNTRASHFYLLCIGEMGPSYANTRILDICDKGHDRLESLRCGDYENNNGTGGKPLVPITPEDVADVRLSARGGILAGIGTGEDRMIGQFKIYLKHDARRFCKSTFATIEDGLDILNRAVVRYSNIAEVFIKECGVVLWKQGST